MHVNFASISTTIRPNIRVRHHCRHVDGTSSWAVEPDDTVAVPIVFYLVGTPSDLRAFGQLCVDAANDFENGQFDVAAERADALCPAGFTPEQQQRLVTAAVSAVRAGLDIDDAIGAEITTMLAARSMPPVCAGQAPAAAR